MAKLTKAQKALLGEIGAMGGKSKSPEKLAAIANNLLKANAALKIKRLQAIAA